MAVLRLITDNPYRVLGVYANSPKRDIVANKGKASAFLKVGKIVEYPLDLNGILPSLNRTLDMFNDAESHLAIAKEQIRYAQFWFLKITPIDDIAFNHLIAGDMAMAKSLWLKQDSLSSLQNRMVCDLIGNNISSAMKTAEVLYNSFGDTYISSIDANSTLRMTGKDLLYQFVDSLGVEIGMQKLLDCSLGEDVKSYISGKAVGPLVSKINAEIDKAHKVDNSNPVARKEAGQKLMEATKEPLQKLRGILSVGNQQYAMIADKLGIEILQCGIDYFNNSEDDDAPQTAMKLQKYAQSIVVGSLAKDRCNENVKTLEKIGDEYIVRTELLSLAKHIESLKDYKHSIGLYPTFSMDKEYITWLDNISVVLVKCIKDLLSIEEKLGKNNNLYISISSVVASTAINAVVKIINEMQLSSSSYVTMIVELPKATKKAVEVMNLVGSLAMDAKTKNYYTENKSILNSMNNSLNKDIAGTKGNGGCYIATMAYGSYEHPQVMVLRNFRDYYLAKREWGRNFIKFYYKHSPGWVEKLKDYKLINKLIRHCLDIFVMFLGRYKNR